MAAREPPRQCLQSNRLPQQQIYQTSSKVPVLYIPPTTTEQQPNVPILNSEVVRTLRLGNNTILSFSQADLPASPYVSFANDIPRLGRMWDDTLPGWDANDCVLRIKDYPIALKYWPDVFSWRQGNRWDKLKKSWNEWQVWVHWSSIYMYCITITNPIFLCSKSSFSLSAGTGLLLKTSGQSSQKMDNLSHTLGYLSCFVNNDR